MLALQLVLAISQQGCLLARPYAVCREALTAGQPGVHRSGQQAVFRIQRLEHVELLFHRPRHQPGLGRLLPHGKQLHGHPGIGQAHLGLGQIHPSCTLGTAGYLLHETDTLHGHAFGVQIPGAVTFNRQVLQPQGQAWVWQLAGRHRSTARRLPLGSLRGKRRRFAHGQVQSLIQGQGIGWRQQSRPQPCQKHSPYRTAKGSKHHDDDSCC